MCLQPGAGLEAMSDIQSLDLMPQSPEAQIQGKRSPYWILFYYQYLLTCSGTRCLADSPAPLLTPQSQVLNLYQIRWKNKALLLYSTTMSQMSQIRCQNKYLLLLSITMPLVFHRQV